MQKDKVVERISVGFNQAEWDQLEAALRISYLVAEKDSVRTGLTSAERGHFLRCAIWAICAAIIRDGHSFRPLACDQRCENKEERLERFRRRFGANHPYTRELLAELDQKQKQAAWVMPRSRGDL